MQQAAMTALLMPLLPSTCEPTHDTEPNPSMTHLLISVHEVHDSIMVVVVVHVLGCIHRQHEVVGPQPIPLGVSVTEDTCLQHLVITVPNTCNTNIHKLLTTHVLLAHN